METLPEWLNPLNWLTWLQENPLLALLIVVPFVAFVIWRLVKGGVGVRRAVINVTGIGLIFWGTLWFADWVQPSLTSEDLFTPPVVGPQAVKSCSPNEKRSNARRPIPARSARTNASYCAHAPWAS